jgi:hypothetical protein
LAETFEDYINAPDFEENRRQYLENKNKKASEGSKGKSCSLFRVGVTLCLLAPPPPINALNTSLIHFGDDNNSPSPQVQNPTFSNTFKSHHGTDLFGNADAYPAFGQSDTTYQQPFQPQQTQSIVPFNTFGGQDPFGALPNVQTPDPFGHTANQHLATQQNYVSQSLTQYNGISNNTFQETKQESTFSSQQVTTNNPFTGGNVQSNQSYDTFSNATKVQQSNGMSFQHTEQTQQFQSIQTQNATPFNPFQNTKMITDGSTQGAGLFNPVPESHALVPVRQQNIGATGFDQNSPFSFGQFQNNSNPFASAHMSTPFSTNSSFTAAFPTSSTFNSTLPLGTSTFPNTNSNAMNNSFAASSSSDPFATLNPFGTNAANASFQKRQQQPQQSQPGWGSSTNNSFPF